MIILGIDPSINNVGYGIIKLNSYNSINYLASGVIKTTNCDLLHIRLAIIVKGIEELIAKYNPLAIGMEEVFINTNAQSSIKLCHARGAIMSVIGKENMIFKEFAPNKIKKILTGSGHADKLQMIHMIKLVVKNVAASITNDEADALAVAYAVSIEV